MHLGPLHSFRAVAALIVVCGHTVANFAWTAGSVTHAMLLDLLDNGTVLWVFLTGYLFELHVDRFRYRTYLRRRLLSAVLPYLVLCVPLVVYDVLARQAWTKHPAALAGTSPLYQIGWFVAKGKVPVNYTMWFVPMITLFYLASPLFARLARHPRAYAVLLAALVPLSMVLQRSPDSVSLMAVYFLGAFVLGMWASHTRSWSGPWLRQRWPWLLGVFVVTTVALALFARHHGNYVAERPFSSDDGYVDWLFPQKLLLCLVLLGVLTALQPRVGEYLSPFGDLSRALFFLHVPVLYCFALASRRTGPPAGSAVEVVATAALAVGLIAAGAVAARRLLGDRSHYLLVGPRP